MTDPLSSAEIAFLALIAHPKAYAQWAAEVRRAWGERRKA